MTDVNARPENNRSSSSKMNDPENLLEAATVEAANGHHHEEHDYVLSDSEDEDEFINRYGEVNFQYIKKPREALWFSRPHALNYFKSGVLYRTKGERTSGKTELFLDLLYVGIVASLAGNAVEEGTAGAFLKYVLLFLPTWVVWSDIKDFMNYYYNGDLSQKFYILWILILLVIYDNNCPYVLESRGEAAFTVIPYILCRLSLAVSLLVYSVYVMEHRLQMRWYACSIIVTCCLWIVVIFLPKWGKVGMSFGILILEQACFSVIFHPWFKRKLKLVYSTALNIEHEVERFGAFYIIAIGEFLYKTVAENPIGKGFSHKLGRGICLLIISYQFLWLYFNGGTSNRGIHPLRRSGAAAIAWIYSHVPLIAGLILAADAGGHFIGLDETSTAKHPHEEAPEVHSELLALLVQKAAEVESEEAHEPSMYALSFFFTGGLCVALLALGVQAFAEKSRDPANSHILSKLFRVTPRFPFAIIILCLSFAEMSTTNLLGFTAMLMVILTLYEQITMTSRLSLPRYFGGCRQLQHSEEIERF